jgi:hypothetical protein
MNNIGSKNTPSEVLLDNLNEKTFPKADNGIKQTLKVYESDFLLKKELTVLLEQKIKGFSWGLCE